MIRTLSAALLAGTAAIAGAAAPSLQPDLATLQAVPRVELPAAAVSKALAEPVKGRPYQYAVPVALELAPRQGLQLERGGIASWRLRLHSPGAKSLSLQLARPGLPAGATLWTYDPRGRVVHGPFDATRLAPSGLWTPPVEGEELVVEIRAPADRAGALKLGPAKAFHGFRDWSLRESAAGSCNLDSTCYAEWSEDAGAVARISIGNAFLCSGQLVNNVNQDQTRLFLTANHCGIDGDSGPADSVLFYFNYTRPCGSNTSPGPPAPTFQTSNLLARDTSSDFALLLITDASPLPAGVHFAGWDATGTGSDSGVAIHHPSGDEKKIAFHTQPAVHGTIDIGGICDIDAWEVRWSSGTTEGGSSGGGLWNSSHHLVGVLTGGLASCGNPSGLDYFGRLDRGWTANPQASGQLKAHLDPDNTCVAVVPRLDPATSPGPVAPTAQNRACSGPASRCDRPRGGGGGAFGTLTLVVLLASLVVRRRA